MSIDREWNQVRKMLAASVCDAQSELEAAKTAVKNAENKVRQRQKKLAEHDTERPSEKVSFVFQRKQTA